MRRTAALILVTLGFAIFLRAQTKPPVTPADYGQFETLAPAGFGNASGGLSPDGKWLAYGINRSNRSNELRITNIGDGTTKTTAFGTQPVFSSDSHWVAFAIGNSEAADKNFVSKKGPSREKWDCSIFLLGIKSSSTPSKLFPSARTERISRCGNILRKRQAHLM